MFMMVMCVCSLLSRTIDEAQSPSSKIEDDVEIFSIYGRNSLYGFRAILKCCSSACWLVSFFGVWKNRHTEIVKMSKMSQQLEGAFEMIGSLMQAPSCT